MFIKSYGLFWQRDEVEWSPGSGKSGAFRLLGRQGAIYPKLRVADFRYQRGIYILYGNYGSYYVGLSDKQGLGKRLKDHLNDHHNGYWDRFSWFGFNRVLKSKDQQGLCKLKENTGLQFGSSSTIIRDVEALLIRAIGGYNISKTKFSSADEWIQVKRDEVEKYLNRI
jgi:hypothetical protein